LGTVKRLSIAFSTDIVEKAFACPSGPRLLMDVSLLRVTNG